MKDVQTEMESHRTVFALPIPFVSLYTLSVSSQVCFAQPLKHVGTPSGYGMAAQCYGLRIHDVCLRERSKRMQEAKLDDYQRQHDVILGKEVTADKEKLDLEFEVHLLVITINKWV